jgi:transposase
LRLQRRPALCQRGSWNRGKMLPRGSRLKACPRGRRMDFVERVSADLTESHGLFAFEALPKHNMARSARRTVDNLGSRVAQRASLNRVILDGSWGGLQTRAEQKAARAGAVVVYVAAAYSSQECRGATRATRPAVSRRAGPSVGVATTAGAQR